MKPVLAARALAAATSAMLIRRDVIGALVDVLEKCKVGLDIQAGGILVQTSHGLDLLASTGHTIAEIELHQLHAAEGPCIDSHHGAIRVQEHSRTAVLRRWPEFGRTMVNAGFESVHASPLRYGELTFGAVGLFRTVDEPFTDDESAIAQAFADIAAMLIVRPRDTPAAEIPVHLDDALSTRIMIERAKGVLAENHDLSMADAYALLVQSARDRHQPLTAWAATVLSNTDESRK